MPMLVALQEMVAVPEPIILFGAIESQIRPGSGVFVRVTSPLNSLSAITLIVDDNEALTAPVGDDACILKSAKLKIVVVWCVSEPLVPVNVRIYSPAAVALQETVAMPDPLTSGGWIKPHVSP